MTLILYYHSNTNKNKNNTEKHSQTLFNAPKIFLKLLFVKYENITRALIEI